MVEVKKFQYKSIFEYQNQTIPLITSAETEDQAMANFVHQLANRLRKGLTVIGTMILTKEIQFKIRKIIIVKEVHSVNEGTLCEDRDRKGGYLVP